MSTKLTSDRVANTYHSTSRRVNREPNSSHSLLHNLLVGTVGLRVRSLVTFAKASSIIGTHAIFQFKLLLETDEVDTC
jgi:hypothetical protein